MTELFALRALLFAGECFAASVLLLGLAAIATCFLKSASLRHLVWLTAFGTVLVLPLAALVVPPQITIHQHMKSDPAAVQSLHLSSATALPMLPPAQQPSWNIDAKDVGLALFALWIVGFGWSALRLLMAAIGINALSMSSRRLKNEEWCGLPNLTGCDLRVASDRSGPMTWGTLRPVILLPNEAPGWPPERLRAVLLHELAHVQRCDSFAQTLSRMACALYWPNPLAWIGVRAMRRDAEIAADDAVIGAGMLPSTYAAELLTLATEYRGGHRFADTGLAMAAESRLEARMKSILGANRSRKGVTHMDIAKIAGTGLLAVAAFALVRPSLADNAPVQPVRLAAIATHPTLPKRPVLVAENDRPPVPPSPDTPPIPPTPPVPHAPLHPRVPPEPAVPPSRDTHYAIDLHGNFRQSLENIPFAIRHMNPEERRKFHDMLHHMRREIHDAMAKAVPERERAMAELRAHQEEMKALKPQIEQAMREARPQIEKAMRDARRAMSDASIDERVHRHIETAMRHAEMQMHRYREMGDRDGDADWDSAQHERDAPDVESDNPDPREGREPDNR